MPHPKAVRTLDANRLIPENRPKRMLMRPRATRNSMAPIVTEDDDFDDATVPTSLPPDIEYPGLPSQLSYKKCMSDYDSFFVLNLYVEPFPKINRPCHQQVWCIAINCRVSAPNKLFLADSRKETF